MLCTRLCEGAFEPFAVASHHTNFFLIDFQQISTLLVRRRDAVFFPGRQMFLSSRVAFPE